MKKSLLLLVTVAVSLISIAQGGDSDCSNLIISEYVEGWSNNKALEVYNSSPNPIDMDSYWLVRFRNQQQTHSNPVDLEGTLMPYETYVVIIDKRDSTGVDFEAPVWQELQMQADTFANPVYNDGMETMYFNGDDVVMLLGDDDVTVHDMFGKVADLPNPDGWGPYIDNSGDPAFMSQDHSLIRKSDVADGVHSNPTVFDLELEWDTLPANTFDNLGMHECICAGIGINENNVRHSVQIYPNPVIEDGSFTISSEYGIEKIIVYSVTGELVYQISIEDLSNTFKVNTSRWVKGAYLVNLELSNNIVTTKRLIVK